MMRVKAGGIFSDKTTEIQKPENAGPWKWRTKWLDWYVISRSLKFNAPSYDFIAFSAECDSK